MCLQTSAIATLFLLLFAQTNNSLNWRGYTQPQLRELERLLEQNFQNDDGTYPIDISQPLPNENQLFNDVHTELNNITLTSGPISLQSRIRRPLRLDLANFGLSPTSIHVSLNFNPSAHGDALKRLIDYTGTLLYLFLH